MRYVLILAGLTLLSACSASDETVTTAPDPTVPAASMDSSGVDPTIATMDIPDMADRIVTDGEELSALLASVNSAETAEAVRPNIDAMVKDYRLMLERLESMDQPSFSDMAALASRGAALAETQQSVAEQLTRIYRDHPEAADVLSEALDGFGRP